MGRRLQLGDAVPKLIRALRRGKHADAKRYADVILPRSSATVTPLTAAAVRESIEGTNLVGFHPPTPTAAVWQQAQPPEDLVLSGALAWAYDQLVAELEATPRLLAAGVDAPTRVLFCGPSGTGKTLAARWIAWGLGLGRPLRGRPSRPRDGARQASRARTDRPYISRW